MLPESPLTRRNFISVSAAGAGTLLLPEHLMAEDIPTSNPVASYQLAWTDQLNWSNVLDITTVKGSGKYWDKRLAAAQRQLDSQGSGGIVYFPAGEIGRAHV